MSNPNAQDLLKKINYIEADIEIQKQILFSTPSDQREEMEKIISTIQSRKKEIDELRAQLKKIDPAEFDRILTFEKAIEKFKKLAVETEFETLINKNIGEDCFLELLNQQNISCLIKACDKNGNWTIITEDGEMLQYTKEQVAEKPPENN